MSPVNDDHLGTQAEVMGKEATPLGAQKPGTLSLMEKVYEAILSVKALFSCFRLVACSNGGGGGGGTGGGAGAKIEAPKTPGANPSDLTAVCTIDETIEFLKKWALLILLAFYATAVITGVGGYHLLLSHGSITNYTTTIQHWKHLLDVSLALALVIFNVSFILWIFYYRFKISLSFIVEYLPTFLLFQIGL